MVSLLLGFLVRRKRRGGHGREGAYKDFLWLIVIERTSISMIPFENFTTKRYRQFLHLTSHQKNIFSQKNFLMIFLIPNKSHTSSKKFFWTSIAIRLAFETIEMFMCLRKNFKRHPCPEYGSGILIIYVRVTNDRYYAI